MKRSAELVSMMLAVALADGRFALYEDDGVSYGYERDEWSRIPIRYDDGTGMLYIGERIGGFDGMAEERRIEVRWITGPGNAASDFDAPADVTVSYTGAAITIPVSR